MQAVKYWFALVLLVILAVGVVAGFVDIVIHGILTIGAAL